MSGLEKIVGGNSVGGVIHGGKEFPAHACRVHLKKGKQSSEMVRSMRLSHDCH